MTEQDKLNQLKDELLEALKEIKEGHDRCCRYCLAQHNFKCPILEEDKEV